MYYTRKYESKVLELMKFFPAVGIIGPRQVGKTTLARTILKVLSVNTVYLDLERTSDANKLSEPELFLTQYSNSCVVIDEIQRMPELFPLLRSLIDENRVNGRYLILGSASPHLLRQSSESLAGRIAYTELMPFDLQELPVNCAMEKNWFRGGFPGALFAGSDKMTILWLDNFIKTYTERDLLLLGLNNSPVFLYRLWMMLSHFAGRIINYTDIANSLDSSVKTIKKYIDFYEKAYLVLTIPPFFTNISKRLVKARKLLFRDTGILHRLWGLNTTEELYGHPMLGSSWENYCVLQIINSMKETYDISYFRTHDGAEIDLILSKGLKPEFAIEIKYSSAPTVTKSNTMAFNAVHAKNNFVITPGGDHYKIRENITTCNVKTFIDTYL